MRTGIMVIWLVCVGLSLAAQLYSTQSGKILVSGKYNGAGVAAVSNSLQMQINYDRAEMQMRLVIPTILSDNDSLNLLLQKLSESEAHFTGKMNINYVQTKSHANQKFKTDGTLTINGMSRAFSFFSLLKHFPRGNVSCDFSAAFIIDLNDFGIITEPGENRIAIRFTQLIVKKPGEQ